MLFNSAKQSVLNFFILSILTASFSSSSLASWQQGKILSDKGKEEAEEFHQPIRNSNIQGPNEPFQSDKPTQMQEVKKTDPFVKLRTLKAPQIYKPSDKQEGFEFDGGFIFAGFKSFLPKSEQELQRSKMLLTSLKRQRKIALDRCSHLRHQIELASLESLQKDEELAQRLQRENTNYPFNTPIEMMELEDGFESNSCMSAILSKACEAPPALNLENCIIAPSALSFWDLPFEEQVLDVQIDFNLQPSYRGKRILRPLEATSNQRK